MIVRTALRIPHVAAIAALAGAPVAAGAQEAPVQVAEVSPRFHAVTDGLARLLVFVGEDASIVVGAQRPALVERALTLLADLGAPPVRYALAMEDAGAAEHADGGWARRGAVTLSHEMLYAEMRRHRRAGGASADDAALPSIGFSNVVQLFVPGEEVHVVHSRPGAGWADAIVHFHREGLAFLGNTYTADGYPEIHPERGASLPGLLRTVGFFLENFAASPQLVEPIVPARGPVGTLADLAEYHAMLSTVYERVKALADGGSSVEEIVAARPTADLDPRWGRGPVTPDRFTAAVAETLGPRRPEPSGHGHH